MKRAFLGIAVTLIAAALMISQGIGAANASARIETLRIEKRHLRAAIEREQAEGDRLEKQVEKLKQKAVAPAPKPKPRPKVKAWKSSRVSWYGGRFIGRHTANGEVYTGRAMTAAATRDIPFGAIVEIRYHSKTIRVRINDRGGFAKYGRKFDLSEAAATALGMKRAGVVSVDWRRVKP